MNVKKAKKGSLGVVWQESDVLTTKLFNNASTAVTGIYTTDLLLNSAFNPLGSLSAVQPARYDQLDAMYRKMLVKRVRARLTFCGSTATVPVVFTAYPVVAAGALAAPATFQAASSIPGAKSVEWVPGSPAKVLEFDIDVATMLGHPLTTDTYGLGASPATQIRLGVFMQNSVAEAKIMTWMVETWQDTTCSERKYVVDA